MAWVVFLSLLIVFEAVADVMAKEWQLHGSALRWLAAISAYVIGNMFWLYSLKSGAELGRGAIIFSVASATIAAIIGLLFYKEEVTRLQFAGMILGVCAITLILWE